jgi:hypothetical protein
MKAAMKSSYDKALQLEKSAVELQANAEKDREYVQAELDATLEHHSDVLEHFVLIPHNQLELRRLTTSVEEGRAYMHEVIGLGERLLHFKATRLESGISIVQNDLASGAQLASHSQAFQQAPSPPTNRTACWRYWINSLLGRRCSDVRHPPCSSPILKRNDENIDPPRQEQTIDGQGCDNNDVVKACSSPKNTSTKSISTGFLQNATPLPPDGSIAINAIAEDQIEDKGKMFTAESTAVRMPSMVQSHTEENFLPPGSPESDASIPDGLQKRASEAIITQPAPKRGLTKAEKVTAINEHQTLARYRQLIASEQGPNDRKISQAKKKIKQEMQARVEKDDAILLERKGKLISYGFNAISELIDRENRLSQPELSKTNAKTLKKRKRKRSKSATTQPATQQAVKRRRHTKIGTKEQKAVAVSAPATQVRFGELFASAKDNSPMKSPRAKKAMKPEMKRKISQDGTIPHSKKQVFLQYRRQQVDPLAGREDELQNQGHLERRHTTERHQPAEMSDWAAGGGRAETENEREGSTVRRAVYPTEMSDVSVDDAQWP